MARAAAATCLLLLAGLAVAGPDAGSDAIAARCHAMPSPEAVLRRLNAERARGVSCRVVSALAPTLATTVPLRWNPNLAAVAAAQADDMAAVSRMGHQDSRHRGLSERLGAMGYRFSMAVENVAFGYQSLDTVVDAWLASEGHCTNLMNSSALELGLACSDGTVAGQDRYWALVLGAPPRPR